MNNLTKIGEYSIHFNYVLNLKDLHVKLKLIQKGFFKILETYMVNLMRFLCVHVPPKPSMVSSDDFQSHYKDDVIRVSDL